MCENRILSCNIDRDSVHAAHTVGQSPKIRWFRSVGRNENSHGDGRPFMSRGPSSHETEATDIEGVLAPPEDSSSDSPPPSSPGSDSSMSASFGVNAGEGHLFWLASESTATEVRKPKGVCFVLESQPSTSDTRQTVFMPQDETTEAPKFGSRSKWKRAQLPMLNVEYDPTAHFPFNFDSVPMSPALDECILLYNLVLITGKNLFARHIAQFDMNSIASGQQFDYKATGLEVDDAVKLGLFVTAAEELAKIILQHTSLPTNPQVPADDPCSANLRGQSGLQQGLNQGRTNPRDLQIRRQNTIPIDTHMILPGRRS